MARSGKQVINLVTIHKDNINVDNDALFGLMQREELKGCPLVIVSIAGAFRSGKSFILNFFIRYLRNKGWKNSDWFGGSDEPIAGGFSWKPGKEACTKGINVWPEIFRVPITDEREAAVILVDTQGLFDNNTSPDINAKLMSLSTLFSSHQILNLIRHIEARDLEHLQLCVAFAKAAGRVCAVGQAKPFQTLTFLVRDWDYEDQFGDSTEDYLREYFGKRSSSQTVEEVKKSIPDAFSEVRCTLLPDPGKMVKGKKISVLTNKDLDREFEHHVSMLVERILHPDNLVIKMTSDGKEETADSLMNLIAEVGNTFVDGKLPTAQTLLESVVKGCNANARTEGFLMYVKRMNEECGTLLDMETLLNYHHKALKQSIDHFRSLTNVGDGKSKVVFLEQMKKECEAEFRSVEWRNDGRKFEKMLELRILIFDCTATYADKLKMIGPEADSQIFERKSKDYRREAMAQFESATHPYKNIFLEVTNLEQELADAITTWYKDISEARKRKRDDQRQQNREECSELQHKLKLEFEDKSDQYETEYEPDLEQILQRNYDYALSQYEDDTTTNPEKEEVRETRTALKECLQRPMKRALGLNKEKRELKISEFRDLVHECLLTYESTIRQVGPDNDNAALRRYHSQYEKEAMKRLDDKTRPFQRIFPEIQQLKEKLQREISSMYCEIKEDRERRRKLKQAQSREESTNAMMEILNEFRRDVRKYGGRYEANIVDILGSLEKSSIANYNSRMKDNTEVTTVNKNRETLRNDMDDLIQKTKLSNEQARASKLSDIRALKQECLVEYERKIEGVELGMLNRIHGKCSREALRKFDSRIEGHKNLPGVFDLRKDLDEEMSRILETITEFKQNKKMMEEERNKEKSLKSAHDLIQDVEKVVVKHEREYEINLEKILRDSERKALNEYENICASNPEKQAVQENQQMLARNLSLIVRKALDVNKDNLAKKVSEHRSVKWKCISDYKTAMKEVKPSELVQKHHQYRDIALGKFNKVIKTQERCPEISELRENLEDEISEIFENIKQNVEKEQEIQARRQRQESEKCMARIIRLFDQKVDQYRDKYEEDLVSILQVLKREYSEQYLGEMASNNQKNTEDLYAELDDIIARAKKTNEINRDRLEEKAIVIGRRLADEFTLGLKAPMAKAKISEEAFDKYSSKFMAEIKNEAEFKKLPDWGKNMVKEAVKAAEGRLKQQNKENRRGVDLKKFKNVLEFIGTNILPGLLGILARMFLPFP